MLFQIRAYKAEVMVKHILKAEKAFCYEKIYNYPFNMCIFVSVFVSLR
jgi:hypothetical protein